MYGANPGAQIVKGHVHFSHQGAQLWCDSAYFYQESNSVKAFGHVRYQQGSNLRLKADRASYDGQAQLLVRMLFLIMANRFYILTVWIMTVFMIMLISLMEVD